MMSVMLYAAAIACLLAAAALTTERVLAQLGWPRRGVWLVALIASLAVPAYSLTLRGASAPIVESASGVSGTDGSGGAEASGAEQAIWAEWIDWADWAAWPEWIDWTTLQDAAVSTGWPAWPSLDRPLATLWAVSTAAMLSLIGIVWLAVGRAVRRWPAVELHGVSVSVSERLGPAVFGFLAPRIVAPRWLLEAPAPVRAVALRHEREHIAAYDHMLLGVALLLTALAPWNPALWWQLKRLRFAIEVDCDARVTRRGTDPVSYGNVLLAVRRRRAATAFAAVSLTEPVSQLERRIRVLMGTAPKARPVATALSAIVAAALLGASCAVAPPEPGAREGAAESAAEQASLPRQPVTELRLGGERVVFLVDVSGSMVGRTSEELERWRDLPAADRRQAPKWQQLVDTFEKLAEQVSPGARFQVIAFDDEARPLIAGTGGTWLEATDELLERAVRILRDETAPEGSSDLGAAFAAAGALEPAADNIFLLTDGLPSGGFEEGVPEAQARMRRLVETIGVDRSGASVNVLLLPKEGEPMAAPAFWTLAFETDGVLLAPAAGGGEDEILGVPSDSEYLAFVIDTSGSMRQYGWDAVRRHVTETVDAHPQVEGIQFLTDEGEYLLEEYRGDWIPNDAAGRSAALDALADWSAFSNSVPNEGIVAAIEALYSPGRRVALYVYGDDLARGSLNAIGALESIERANRVAETGERKVRIHAVALPIYLEVTDGQLLSAAGYAALMRELAQRNGGSFIALSAL